MLSARNKLGLLVVILAALVQQPNATGQTVGDQSSLTNAVTQASARVPPADIYKIPAKKLFGTEKTPANLAARAIGNYSRGCLSGAQALPVNGEAWQVMRTSRNRNWGTPALLNVIERLAKDAKQNDGWNGLMVGDISQPRGGPM